MGDGTGALDALRALLSANASALDATELATGVALATRLISSWQGELSTRTAVANADVTSAAAKRGPTYLALATSLYGIDAAREDPFAYPELPAEDHSALFTNVPQCFLDALLARLKPSFLVEVGSWKGGSALRIASAAARATPADAALPCLLCIDTWLGDGGAWIDRCTGWRDGLMLSHGLPRLFRQFVANTKQHAPVILPWPIASLTALRTLQHLVLTPASGVPRPDFVYLDAAHEKGETKLEITRAFDLLRPGGLLVGDDLDWFAVESDLQEFCAALPPAALVPAEADELLRGTPHLYATGLGYWVLDSVPRQWMMRKSETADATMAALRASVEADEYGPPGAAERDYVPLHDGDREALRLYEEGVRLSEQGAGKDAARCFKQAAAASPSLALHFKLEAFTTVVERSLAMLEAGGARGGDGDVAQV